MLLLEFLVFFACMIVMSVGVAGIVGVSKQTKSIAILRRSSKRSYKIYRRLALGGGIGIIIMIGIMTVQGLFSF